MEYIYTYLVQYKGSRGDVKTATIASFSTSREDIEEEFYRTHFTRDIEIIGSKREYINY